MCCGGNGAVLRASVRKDDVVARVGEAQIDFRSVSRVGMSDLGANTARIIDLRVRTEALLGSASRGTPPAP